MDIFALLAKNVESSWNMAGNDLDAFPNIATKALQEFEYGLTQKALNEALANWFMDADPLPSQINVHNTFGQPPITLFNNHKFVVDIYIWMNFDTSIHSHGFRGAFRVLHGKSLHEVFSVKRTQEVSDDVMLTELGIPMTEVLGPGSTRTISPGLDLTHRVIHLESPTVTLCVKTINEPDLFQWNYFPNGLAIQKRNVSSDLIKKIYYFQYMKGQNAVDSVKFLQEILNQCDLSTQMNLSEELACGAYDLAEDVAGIIMDKIADKHANSEWFRRYEELNAMMLAELHFEHTNVPSERLLAHFVNCGYGLKRLMVLLSQGSGDSLTQNQVLATLALMTEDERFFCAEVPHSNQIKKIQDFIDSGI